MARGSAPGGERAGSALPPRQGRPSPRPALKLDAYDVKLLVTLQRDGRITKLRLAEEIGLSPSPCWERMRRLERLGLIRGYHADIDIHRVARIETFFVEVNLKNHEAADFARFEAAVLRVPEVVECHALGGGVDYLLRVVATDIGHYQELMESLLVQNLGIQRYFTYAVTKSVKRLCGYPIRRLRERAGAAAEQQ